MAKKINLKRLAIEFAAPTAAKPETEAPSDMAILRELYPLIQQKRKEGSRPMDVVAWLKSQGVEIRIDTYQVYMSRLRRENGDGNARRKRHIPIVVKTQAIGQADVIGATHVVTSENELPKAESNSLSRSGVKQEGGHSILNLKRTLQADPDRAEREAHEAASRFLSKRKHQKEQK